MEKFLPDTELLKKGLSTLALIYMITLIHTISDFIHISTTSYEYFKYSTIYSFPDWTRSHTDVQKMTEAAFTSHLLGLNPISLVSQFHSECGNTTFLHRKFPNSSGWSFLGIVVQRINSP